MNLLLQISLIRNQAGEIYGHCVLEYSFAFWQWGHNVESIPNPNAEPQLLFDHFWKVASPNYFPTEGGANIYPFFIPAGHDKGEFIKSHKKSMVATKHE